MEKRTLSIYVHVPLSPMSMERKICYLIESSVSSVSKRALGLSWALEPNSSEYLNEKRNSVVVGANLRVKFAAQLI